MVKFLRIALMLMAALMLARGTAACGIRPTADLPHPRQTAMTHHLPQTPHGCTRQCPDTGCAVTPCQGQCGALIMPADEAVAMIACTVTFPAPPQSTFTTPLADAPPVRPPKSPIDEAFRGLPPDLKIRSNTMEIIVNTHSLKTGALALALLAATSLTAAEAAMVVYKDAYCTCCEVWADALKAAGVALRIEVVEDMDVVKAREGVPADVQSCHTAVADGYVFEGHVPLKAVQRVMREKPDITGIAVAGMPSGTLGMGGHAEPYDVIAFGKDGSQSVYMEVRP